MYAGNSLTGVFRPFVDVNEGAKPVTNNIT